ncbi:MAG: alpha/beta fold hydrolase [Thermoleophilia bacterium]
MAIGAGAIPNGRARAGTTPREVAWTRNKTTLYRYLPSRPRRHRTPVLLVYALINRPYVFDLLPGRSFVRHLLDEGYEVYLLDWGRPGWEDRGVGLDELIDEHLPDAVERMAAGAGAGGEYTILGYCMGGTMAAVHAALRPEGLRNLIALTTPVDFADPGPAAAWMDPRHLDATALAGSLGNISPSLVDLATKMLRPVANAVDAQLVLRERIARGDDLTFWRAVDQWVNDAVPFSGAAFVQWVGDFYQQNLLVRDALTVAGRSVRLSEITAALLAIAGSRDHLVPPQMARPLVDLVASPDRRYLELPAGHVGILVGSGARTDLWPEVTDWLDARSD